MSTAPQQTDSIRRCADNITHHLEQIVHHNRQADWHREALRAEKDLLERLKPAEPVRSEADIRARLGV